MEPCQAVLPTPWHLSIGVFIGILGFLGVVVPLIREKVSRREKAAWTALLALLLYLELRSIHLDQIQHDREQEFSRCQDAHNFQHIADTLAGSIQTSQAQYDSTIGHVDGVLKTTQTLSDLTKSNLESITGGNSYADVFPQAGGADIPLALHNEGKDILSGVRLTIANLQNPDWGMDMYKPIEIGTIGPYGFARVPTLLTPKPEAVSGIASYWIFIDAQNGMVDEMLQFRQSKKFPTRFEYRYWVTRHNMFDRSGKPIFGPKSMTRLENHEWSDEIATKPPH